MDRGDIDLTIRTAASITFKNVVKRCWETDEKISPQDRQQVKVHIVKERFFIKNKKKPLRVIFKRFFAYDRKILFIQGQMRSKIAKKDKGQFDTILFNYSYKSFHQSRLNLNFF